MSTRGIVFTDKQDSADTFTEQKLFLGQYLVSKYAWSKFMAEREILQAVSEQGLKAKIMRVGNLSARSTDGEFQVNFNSNTFMGRLRIYQMLRACPYSQFDMPIEFSPVDQTAQAIVLLATTPDECCLFHPYNHHQELLGDVLNRMSEIGQEMQLVEDDEYAHRMEMVQQTEEGAKRLSGLVAYLNTTHGRQSVVPTIQNAYTMQVLYRMGFRWDVTTWDYIDRMLQVINGLGFFDDEK
jgi:thioester reductase-like protein